jgi:uncharacterized protein with FMN-binding domain
MKPPVTKYLIGAAVVFIVALYATWSGNDDAAGAPMPPLASNIPLSPSSSSSSSSSQSSTPTGGGASAGAGTPPTNSSTGASAGEYKDGSYTGPVSDAFYGQLQVVAVVSGGKLTDVQFPIYPNDPGHSSDVSATALPALRQEAIAAQSADVQIVSGATQDSEAFQQSLGAALAQAKS